MQNDIWLLIQNYLDHQPPIVAYALVAHTSYGHSARKLSRTLNEPLDIIEKLLLKIKNDLNILIINEGLEASLISDLYLVSTIKEAPEKTDDLSY